jgi:membrane protein YqaA with SNARE-associated domain
MDKSLEGALQLVFAIAIVVAVHILSSDIAALGDYGYAGVFAISLLASATILFPAPGWAVVVALSTSLDPFLLAIAAGAGSAIGELTGFLAGEGIRDILNSRIKETKDVEAIVRRYGVAAIFFFAFVPNPLFDIAGIVSGGLRIRWWKFLLACAAGRMLRFLLLAMAGALTLGLIH